MTISKYKAGILRQVTSGNVQNKIWTLSDNLEVIFDADDRGEAVFADSMENLAEELEYKFPSSQGFSYFSRAGSRIYQYDFPVAQASTSWESIFEEAKKQDKVLIPNHTIEPGGWVTPSNSEDWDGAIQLYAIEDSEEFYGAYSYELPIVQVIYSPNRAKEVQKLKVNRLKQQHRSEQRQRNQTANGPSVPSLTLKALKELHSAFANALFEFDYGTIEAKVQFRHDVGPGGSYLTPKEFTKFKKVELVKQITFLRQLCNRLKIDWRQGYPFEGGDYGILTVFHSYFFPLVQNLIKSKDEDFQIFGRWLKYEQTLLKKLGKQEGFVYCPKTNTITEVEVEEEQQADVSGSSLPKLQLIKHENIDLPSLENTAITDEGCLVHISENSRAVYEPTYWEEDLLDGEFGDFDRDSILLVEKIVNEQANGRDGLVFIKNAIKEPALI